MKKKKYPEDLMEEDLMETIQHRINELNAELKLLYARHGPLYVQPGSWNLRCKLGRDLEREQERLGVDVADLLGAIHAVRRETTRHSLTFSSPLLLRSTTTFAPLCLLVTPVFRFRAPKTSTLDLGIYRISICDGFCSTIPGPSATV